MFGWVRRSRWLARSDSEVPSASSSARCLDLLTSGSPRSSNWHCKPRCSFFRHPHSCNFCSPQARCSSGQDPRSPSWCYLPCCINYRGVLASSGRCASRSCLAWPEFLSLSIFASDRFSDSDLHLRSSCFSSCGVLHSHYWDFPILLPYFPGSCGCESFTSSLVTIYRKTWTIGSPLLPCLLLLSRCGLRTSQSCSVYLASSSFLYSRP